MDSKELEKIKLEVEENSGVISVTMLRLRNAYGAGKLGKHVLASIENNLASLGLGHTPLAEYQHHSVLVYQLGSDIGKVVKAIAEPSEDNARILRSLIDTNAAKKLDKIRELLD